MSSDVMCYCSVVRGRMYMGMCGYIFLCPFITIFVVIVIICVRCVNVIDEVYLIAPMNTKLGC